MFRMQKYGQYSQFSPVGHLAPPPPRLFKDSETPAWLGLNYFSFYSQDYLEQDMGRHCLLTLNHNSHGWGLEVL